MTSLLRRLACAAALPAWLALGACSQEMPPIHNVDGATANVDGALPAGDAAPAIDAPVVAPDAAPPGDGGTDGGPIDGGPIDAAPTDAAPPDGAIADASAAD